MLPSQLAAHDSKNPQSAIRNSTRRGGDHPGRPRFARTPSAPDPSRRAFQRVERERRAAGSFSGLARDVSRASAAAAGFANVRAARQFHYKVAEWDRAEQVGENE